MLGAHRRRGIGSRLLVPLLAFMRAHGKTVATMNTFYPPGHAFLEASGAVLKHRVVENRMRIDGLDADELARWKARGTADGALHFEIHPGRTPMELSLIHI